ncbi:GYD domain-containing protein [Micromonospora purpureochromogenes]|uniref:GYD domain-containing protein n=1 Tax=Micromonospora purpureochromogenes TaxID=47872 RepID=UPI0033E1FEBE
MAWFLLKSTYTVDGLKGLVKDGGTKRAEVVRKMIEDAGGRMESMHFAFAEDDTYVLCELPDQKTVTGLAVAIGATGSLSVRITPVLTPAEVDEVTRMKTTYTPPGQ